jgi:3-hydroxy-9,10-secoandrosta-1,3,5(10)-triene-9,17-dione monooxygenase reductase component
MTLVPESQIDRGIFRNILGHFISGVVIVTGMDGGEPVGFTCQSFFSLSIDPPLIAIAPGRSSTSWPRIQASGCFTVNVLTDEQEPLARGFAASGADKFKGVGWTLGRTSSPRLLDSLIWVDCDIHEIHSAGDHMLVIGSVKALEGGRGEPLVFYRAGFGSYRP